MSLKTKSFLFVTTFMCLGIFSASQLHAKTKYKEEKTKDEDKEWQTMQSEGKGSSRKTTETKPAAVKTEKSVKKEAPKGPSMTVDTANGKIITNKLHFILNEDTPTPESENILKELATLLNQKTDISLRIEGYSDSLGPDRKTMEMSQKRAERVKEILVKNGVVASRLEAVGLGDVYPVASDVTPAGQEKNRRVQFIIVKSETLPETLPVTRSPETTPASPTPETAPAIAAPAESLPTAQPQTQPMQPVTPPTITIPPPAPLNTPTPVAPPLIIVPNYQTTRPAPH